MRRFVYHKNVTRGLSLCLKLDAPERSSCSECDGERGIQESDEKFLLLQVKGKFSKEALNKLDLDIEGLDMYEDLL